ncbi:hypothetical protein B0H34DRAFT_303935 [Crassisporium funariophilum]|nr:hypothetical protein B0H34DRAFT_303935 [Crassisporium funariophilum]
MDTSKHHYQTRIRHNITIKPSARLDPSTSAQHRRPKTATPNANASALAPELQFPPDNVVLHPDDATNKVFLAVARSFLSVGNRAMTIKDIADRATSHGLVCQNLSAAAQAITTYLRAHKARCDKQQDQPLLLSHTLSGTPADDDLVPALYSRSGGDSHPTENRLTNFRKGTAVWYLSRATGVPCPFARAGIRLCDYVDPDAVEVELPPARREKKVEHRCGEKRKRPLRGCVARGSGSDNERPPKVKLTLRLKPLLKPQQAESSTSSMRQIDLSKESDSYDSGDESMSVDSSDEDDESQTAKVNKEEEEPWSLPPYPRRSISIPCYTPSLDTCYPSYPSPSLYKDPYRRSPSIATPPPDSEDEADDFHVTMTRLKDYPVEYVDTDMGWDADDSEGDGETMWESPGPRSPSAPLMLNADVVVKEEPRDVQGMLDAWEDFDSSVRVAEVIAAAVHKVKVEPLDPWDWDSGVHSEWPSEDTTRVKQEDFAVDSLFPPGPSSPISSLSSQFSAFSYSNSPSPGQTTDNGTPELDEEFLHSTKYSTVRPRAKTVPAPAIFFDAPTPTAPSSFTLPPPMPITRQTSSPGAREPSVPSTALVTLLQSMSVNTSAVVSSSSSSTLNIPPPTPCVSPLQTRCLPPSSSVPSVPKVVVHTCQPCTPAISATQIEDISVYQMMLNAFQLLRRIDTDFVNLSPIVAFSGAPHPVLSAIPNAMVITRGSPEVSGTWVPLSVAQAYVGRHLVGETSSLDVFLSDRLVERFPSALQDFHRSNAQARGLKQFGKHFGSTLQASALEVQTDCVPTPSSGGGNSPGGTWDSRFGWMQKEGEGSAPFALAAVLGMGIGMGMGERREGVESVPLSATEQEIFKELCVIPPDWEPEVVEEGMAQDVIVVAPEEDDMEHVSSTASSPLSSPSSPSIMFSMAQAQTPLNEHPDRPLRRSKRVADAIAAAHQPPAQPSRARSRKGGSRNSLS